MPIEPGNTLTITFASEAGKRKILTLLCEANEQPISDASASALLLRDARQQARAENEAKAAAAAGAEPL